ncbi:MAG: 23S rRNA (adenine(2503)-C(2))-methyltransferase RlmN [Solirubrobacterales bacterium]|nr:23S rRNA (adenine(2503)-C(2))-methyltransferase RlmN [Solirubrobacterales bacterium]
MDLNLLKDTLEELGDAPYRAKQVWEWTARGATGYEEMSNLPELLRLELDERVPFSTLELIDSAESRDGTVKALFHTHDKRPVEAVMMKYLDGRRSICVSSQSGCPLTCTFCATGTMAFGRNLTTAEILDQALFFKRIEDNVNHLVFMGMGEPMMNLDNVLESCEKLPDIGITSRRTTVSTVGWLPGIKQFNKIERPVRLALSLHAADPELRSKIMPVNDRWPLEDVLAECRKHYEQNNRRVYIEYVMLDGINDHTIHAKQLAEVLQPHNAFKVNLIPYNPTGTGYGGSARTTIAAFKDTLQSEGVVATVRLTRGQDIAAACGQLVADAIQKAAVSDTDAALA